MICKFGLTGECEFGLAGRPGPGPRDPADGPGPWAGSAGWVRGLGLRGRADGPGGEVDRP